MPLMLHRSLPSEEELVHQKLQYQCDGQQCVSSWESCQVSVFPSLEEQEATEDHRLFRTQFREHLLYTKEKECVGHVVSLVSPYAWGIRALHVHVHMHADCEFWLIWRNLLNLLSSIISVYEPVCGKWFP